MKEAEMTIEIGETKQYEDYPWAIRCQKNNDDKQVDYMYKITREEAIESAIRVLKNWR